LILNFFRDGNATFPIVLPAIEWEKSKTKTSRVQLFNLKSDPFERHNIALDHRDIVEEMTAEILEQIKDAPPQVGAIHYTFRVFIFIIRVLEIVLIVTFGLTIASCWWCCDRRKRSPKDKTNKKE